MTSVNEITGDNLVSKSSNQDAYAEGWDRIFNKKEEPKPYSQPIVLSNKIQCNRCGDIIESLSGHDFKYCSCGAVAVDGGRNAYGMRRIGNPGDWADLSEITSEEDENWFEKVREVFTWGSRGVSGNEPLHRIKLAEMETEHIMNILKTQYHIKGTYVEDWFNMELKNRGYNDKG